MDINPITPQTPTGGTVTPASQPLQQSAVTPTAATPAAPVAPVAPPPATAYSAPQPPPPVAPAPYYPNVAPATAPAPVTLPHTKGDAKVFVALIAGVMSLTGVLIPIVGIPLSITAFAVGTLSLNSVRRTMALASLILGGLGLLLSLAMFGYMFTSQDQGFKSSLGVLAGIESGPEIAVETACYTITVKGDYVADNDDAYCSSQITNEAKGEVILMEAAVNADTEAAGADLEACYDIPLEQEAEFEQCVATAKSKASSKLVNNKEDLERQAEKAIDATKKTRPSLQILSKELGEFAGQDAYIMEVQEGTKYGYTVYILTEKDYELREEGFDTITTNLFGFNYAKEGQKTSLSSLSKKVEFK